MLIIHVHLHAPCRRGNLIRDQMNHKAMSEVQADLKQIQSLSRDKKTIEHWVNIQVSYSVMKWYTGSHEKGFWNSWFRKFSEIMVKISEKFTKGSLFYLVY